MAPSVMDAGSAEGVDIGMVGGVIGDAIDGVIIIVVGAAALVRTPRKAAAPRPRPRGPRGP